MKKEEINEIVTNECHKHESCTENGVCPYWVDDGCSMSCVFVVIPENHLEKPKMTDAELYPEIANNLCVKGCEDCPFSQHFEIHKLGYGCMAKPLNEYEKSYPTGW